VTVKNVNLELIRQAAYVAHQAAEVRAELELKRESYKTRYREVKNRFHFLTDQWSGSGGHSIEVDQRFTELIRAYRVALEEFAAVESQRGDAQRVLMKQMSKVRRSNLRAKMEVANKILELDRAQLSEGLSLRNGIIDRLEAAVSGMQELIVEPPHS
jgi:hypothetical protein